MDRLLLLSLIVLLVSSASCKYENVEFDPNYMVGRHAYEYVIDRHGNKIYCTDPQFSEIACLTKDKIKELADILDNAVVPRGYNTLKKENLRFLKDAIKRMDQE